MTHSRTTPRTTHWLAITGLAIAGLAMNVGCSSSGTGSTDSGAGGSTDAGGTGGKADSGTDTQVVHNINYTFDTDLQGWAFSTYADPTTKNLTGAYAVDAGTGTGTDGSTGDAGDDAAAGDAGATADAGALPGAPLLEWDGTVGQPSPPLGSAKVSVTFTDCNQYVDPGINFTLPKNETGHMLHARLQVTSGTFSGGAQLHITTGADFAYGFAPVNLAANGTFAPVTLDPANQTAAVNPAQVVGLGVQIYSGGICPYPNAGTPVVFNIDTVVD